MSPSTLPMTCSLALATLSGAVFSHWWSLREFSGALASPPRGHALHAPAAATATTATTAATAATATATTATAITVATTAAPAPTATPASQPLDLPQPKVLASQPAPAPVAEPSAAQKEFFESLLDEMKQLRKTNLALRDQMAETNRDLMQLEFRVDTHSASFRPLPLTEDLSSLDASSLDTSTFNPSVPDADPGVLPPRAVMVDRPE